MLEKKIEIDEKYFSEGPKLGRRLDEYHFDRNNLNTVAVQPKGLDWPFPDKITILKGSLSMDFHLHLKMRKTT